MGDLVPPEEQGGDPPCWADQFAPAAEEPDEEEPGDALHHVSEGEKSSTRPQQ
jgi:hypothetical protein